VQAKCNVVTKPRRRLDAGHPNNAVDANHNLLPSIEELMESVAAKQFWRKIDLADRYNDIRIEEHSE
jgi:hypothetical protein